jgi:hypothetical protein
MITHPNSLAMLEARDMERGLATSYSLSDLYRNDSRRWDDCRQRRRWAYVFGAILSKKKTIFLSALKGRYSQIVMVLKVGVNILYALMILCAETLNLNLYKFLKVMY